MKVTRSNAAHVAKRAKEETEAKKAQEKVGKAAQAVATVVKDMRMVKDKWICPCKRSVPISPYQVHLRQVRSGGFLLPGGPNTKAESGFLSHCGFLQSFRCSVAAA